MPRPTEYTPARRFIMQAVMWAILGVTVTLAAVVSRSANRAHRVELSPQSISSGNVTVKLPLKWKLRQHPPDDPRVIAEASEPSDDGDGRNVRILLDRIDTPMSPLEYLRRHFAIESPPQEGELEQLLSRAGEPSLIATTKIAGATGVIVSIQRAVITRRRQLEPHKDVYAIAVFPSLQVFTIHLSGIGETDILDQLVISQIAGGITINDPLPLEQHDAVVTLPIGIQLQAPDDFAAVAQDDANRTDRRFWPTAVRSDAVERLEQNWAAIEVVGVLFPNLNASDPGQKERASAAMLTMLLVRDQDFRGATISQEKGVWRASKPADGDDFPAAAFLLPDPSGRALLAILRGGAGGGGAFDRIWADTQSKVKFLPSSDDAQLQDAGAAEAARVLRDPQLGRLPGERDELWWLDTDQSNHPHVGWANLEWEPRGLAANVEMRQRALDGEVRRVAGKWSMRDDAKQYLCELTRTIAGPQPRTLAQSVNLQRGQLAVSIRINNKQAEQSKVAVPAQFIPGALLPLVMGKLQPGPLMIKTDSFIANEVVGAPEPLAVVIRPIVKETRKPEGDEPLKSLTAEVNGSGRLTRWYFKPTGELESIELPGGVRRTPSDVNSITFAFGKDNQMSP